MPNSQERALELVGSILPNGVSIDFDDNAIGLVFPDGTEHDDAIDIVKKSHDIVEFYDLGDDRGNWTVHGTIANQPGIFFHHKEVESKESLIKGITDTRSNASLTSPGYYIPNHDGSFERIGDTKELIRYHGSIQPEGDILEEIELRTPPEGMGRRILHAVPSVFTSSNPMLAMRYGFPEQDDHTVPFQSRAGNIEGVPQGQLYVLRIRPNFIVDLSECEDNDMVTRAYEAGFDAIECDDRKYHPETVIFNPDTIEIEQIYIKTNPSVVPQGPVLDPSADPNLVELKRQGIIGGPIYDRGARTDWKNQLEHIEDSTEAREERDRHVDTLYEGVEFIGWDVPEDELDIRNRTTGDARGDALMESIARYKIDQIQNKAQDRYGRIPEYHTQSPAAYYPQRRGRGRLR